MHVVRSLVIQAKADRRVVRSETSIRIANAARTGTANPIEEDGGGAVVEKVAVQISVKAAGNRQRNIYVRDRSRQTSEQL